MKKRNYADYGEPEFFDETKDYRQGTIIIYQSPKRAKRSNPKYGYKFVETERKKK